MALIFWRKHEPPDDSEPHDLNQAGEVDEQHPLPMQHFWLPEGSTEYVPVDEAAGLPVTSTTHIAATGGVNGTKQVSVATTATLIAPVNAKRSAIKITNVTGTQVIYLGFTAGVLTTTGDYLHSAAGSNTTIHATNAIYGIAVTGAQTVTVMEESYA